ncbi:MAG TPA: UvrD-helicase domain-containing protein, partial [Gemmatimonadaceae bacterium]
MRILKRAAADFGRHRHDTGQLGFEDLLMLSAKLLREQPGVRDALGERYRHLLIDEFQDTDPLQAEVCFLLASESSQGNDWRTVIPRDGALFLVGDPKQSIYRFRRADISVYEFAKRRMRAGGAVLELTANFRSVPPIADFVNRYFAEEFPADGSDVQAPFSPMQTDVAFTAGQGVQQYWVRPQGRAAGSIINADAAGVASWIEQRIRTGDAKAGDFLILTPKRDPIAAYARALGARNIAVSTAGGRLTREFELNELIVVLHALADPDNPVRVAAALEGMFFGCSPADLYDAHLAGTEFSVTHRPSGDSAAADRALLQLNEWWIVSQRRPADLLVERILEDTGLLCYAASQILGDSRAGALLRLVDVLRTASTAGSSGLADAIERIDRLLTEDSDDIPLRPARADSVRVMNLHKAKGLESKIVILATPTSTSEHPPRVHVVRSEEGAATGGVQILAGTRLIAQPVGWNELADAEQRFAAAETQRLLYVATTRAKKELVIARCELPPTKTSAEPKVDTSFWAPLGELLSQGCGEIHIVHSVAPARRVADRTSQQVAD